MLTTPAGLAIDAAGNLYVADTDNQRIRMVTPAGVVSTIAGSGTQGFADGAANAARFNNPWNVTVKDGVLYVADYFNDRIRMIDATGLVSTIAGSGTKGSADGVGTKASFNNPGGIAVGADGSLYVTDNQNFRIRKVTLK